MSILEKPYKINFTPKRISNFETRFDANINGLQVGYIIIRDKTDNKWMLDFCSEQDFKSFFPDESYIELSSLHIRKAYRNLGIGNAMMSELDSLLKRCFPSQKQIVLFAFPIEFNIERDILKLFYEKYGFKSIPFDLNYIIDKNPSRDNLEQQIEDSEHVMIKKL